ncbi:hypothetical protein [Kribbella sp. CA-294648]|uniref:alpha/beta hydrolase family protein n=1 Tax=Kribbella sp. CA-294648 TaxID=3239948 RepID=UPI003D8A6128
MTITRRHALSWGLGTVALMTGCAREAAPKGQPAQRIRYGGDESQVADLYLPAGDGVVPVAVVIHGGFWMSRYGMELGRGPSRRVGSRSPESAVDRARCDSEGHPQGSSRDRVVPLGQSRRYRDAATQAGDAVTLTELPDVGHFELIDSDHDAWRVCREEIERLHSR